jgi:2-oxoglutarate dehydrogenase E1 component
MQDNESISHAVRLRLLVDAYRLYGHQFADTDPLRFNSFKYGAQPRKVLDYKTYGFTDEDLNMEVFTADGSVGIAEKTPKVLKLGSLIEYLEKVYCGKVGF